MEDNIINYLYNKKDTDGLIQFNNDTLEKQRIKIQHIEENLSNLINKKIHPKCRKQLKRLLDEYAFELLGCSCTEKEIAYQEGFSDAVEMIFLSLHPKL